MTAYVYMLRCADGSLYTGWTNNLKHRFAMHCAGKGAKYTRGRGPLVLVYYEELEDKVTAMRREYEIKQLTRSEKEELVASFKGTTIFQDAEKQADDTDKSVSSAEKMVSEAEKAE